MVDNFKKLSEYISMLDNRGLIFSENSPLFESEPLIRYISYDSKDVKEGTLFICKGLNFKREYLSEAIKKGAVACVAEKGSAIAEGELPAVPMIVISDMRTAMSDIGAMFYDSVWNSRLKMVGITGTKGKSTTATFVKAIMDDFLESAGRKPMGFLSGIYNYDGKERKSSEKMTTLETLELHKHLESCVANDLEYLVMETSSQALKYKRTEALKYAVCGFLNVTEDHISDREHPTFEDYFESKLMIFRQSDIACINNEIEPELYERVMTAAKKACAKVVTFGRNEGADYYGYDVKSSPSELSFKLRHPMGEDEIRVSIGGYFNASNALAAIAICSVLGASVENIKRGLGNVKVEGRMELYRLRDKDVDVIVDYAHNRVSYETLFDNIAKLYPDRKKMLVFGVHGNKAYNRRKDLGEMAQKYADKVVLTEQDIGTDDLKQIWNDILDFLDEKKVAAKIENRVEAIKYGLEIIEDGWVMVIAGNGADRFQKRGLICIPEPMDGEVVQEYIEKHR